MIHVNNLTVYALEPRLAPASTFAAFGLATALSHADSTADIRTATTDEDGYYALQYQHIGAPANY